MVSTVVDRLKSLVRVCDLILEPKQMLPPIKGYEDQPLVSLEQAIQPLIPLVSDVDHMVWTVKENCQNPEDNLTPDESASIMLYTMEWTTKEKSFYFILNATLRSQNRRELIPWFLYLRLFIYSLSKLPSLPVQTIYRGTNLDMSEEFHKEKTFVWWSFTSCTSSIEVLEKVFGQNETRTIFNIETHTGKNISQHSFYRTENEILLYPARQFQVVSTFNSGKQLHIIQLKEIQPPFPLIYLPETTSVQLQTATSLTLVYKNEQLQCRIDKYKQASEINLDNKNLNDDDIEIVVKQAICSKQCKKLWLNRNKITSIGASGIATALNRNTSLEELYLSSNSLNDQAIQSIADTLAHDNFSLKWLFLSSTNMTDIGVEYLSNMLKTNTTLLHLALSFNNITDCGVQLLSNTLIYHNKTLQGLYLDGNKFITDGSIEFLVPMLKQNSSLKILRLSACNISRKGKAPFQQIQKLKKTFSLVI